MPTALPTLLPDLLANFPQPGKLLVAAEGQLVVWQVREMPGWACLALLHLLTFGITIAAGLSTGRRMRVRKTRFPWQNWNLTSASKIPQKFELLNHTILNALPDLIIRMHRDGTYLDIKPATAFSLDLRSLRVGENVRNILPPKAAEQRLQATEIALATGEVQVYEFSLHVEKQEFWREARVLPLDADEVLIVIRDLTQRNQIENALRQSEARFRELAETVQEGFFVYETELAFYSYVNPAYEAIIGVSPHKEQAGMDHWLLNIHPDDRPRIEAALRQESQGNNFHEEYRYIHPNGTTSWLRSQAFPLRDDTGAIVRVVGTVEDITDRKHLEASLQLSEARYRGIVEDQMEMICRYRSDGTFTFANEAFCRYFEVTLNALLGHSFEPFIAEPDRSRVTQLIHSMTPEYPSVVIENRVIAQGQISWTQWNNRAIFDRQGNLIELQAVGQDITDRKRMEEALRASEERFRRAFDDAPIGMSLVSTSGKFLQVNTQYCDIVEYSEEELLNLTFQEITHPDDLEVDMEGMRQLLTHECRAFEMEKRYITKQGTIVPVRMCTAPIRDPNGQILYFVGHIQDIRDRLQVERMKDEFISVVSHELRTPLTSIRGALGILESGVFNNRPEKAQHMLQIAVNNSDRLVRLVNDILTLERLESGKVQLQMEPCQVACMMQEAVDSVQAIADQTSVSLCLTSLDATLLASHDAIVQTLTNLLSNAIKFSASGGTVWLTAEEWESERVGEWKSGRSHPPTHPSTPSPTPSIRFSITDQGRGIPSDKLDIIFEEFQQVDGSDSRKKGGTGLGLAICKRIVQQHQGQIWVDSCLGQGSTFYFTVPLVTAESGDLKMPQPMTHDS